MTGGLSSVAAMLLIGGAAALLGWLVGGGASRDASGQALILRYSGKFRGFAILCGVLMPAGIAIAVFVGIQQGHDSPARTTGLFALAGFFLLLGVPLGLESFRSHVILTEEGITSRTWLGELKHIQWRDVKEVANQPTTGCFRVSGRGVIVKVNHFLGGIELFVAECKQRLEPHRYGDTFDKPLANPFA